jgi:NitT/TauT family transport system permease protein
MGGIKSISQDYINMAKIYSPTPWKMFKYFYVPLIFIYVSPLLSSILSLTFKTVIAGEVLAQLSNSIGGEIFLEKIYLNTSKVFAWIIVVLIFNWFLEVFLKKLNFCCKKLYLII